MTKTQLKPPRHLADLDADGRDAWAEELGLPRMRVRQVARHYFSHFSRAASDMTDLPAAGREELVETLLPPLLQPLRQFNADAGKTIKTLYRLFDGQLLEVVLMAYPGRVTLCVSSQAGCGMACPFCATGQLGLKRNLSAAEILEQVREAAALVQRGELGPGDSAARLSNVVFMGMGEPLANYRALLAALKGISRGFG
ncbi:MAG: radical SAM protein, partial [Bifidobacteriaceae bacterium]|nr:radical SAM protein [Bifidobacteriaceae bacterium]